MKTLFQILAVCCFIVLQSLQVDAKTSSGLSALFQSKFPYSLPALPYASNSLEPSVDQKTMEVHHQFHHGSQVENLNKSLSESDKKLTLQQILAQSSKVSAAIRNNAGGHFNHSLFWTILSADTKNHQMSKQLEQAILKKWSSIDEFKQKFSEAAMTRFGSGWAWFIVDSQGQLQITSSANQDNPFMDTEVVRGIPILGIDVWEHAYYLKYQNRRKDYVTAFWDVIHWKQVSENYQWALKNQGLLK